MIFLASTQDCLSTMSLRPRSEALSLMMTTEEAVGVGAGGSDNESLRMEAAELVTSGCAKGAKAGAGVPE